MKGVSPLRIDLASDTLTKPTPAMREAMAQAEVGDDVFGEDPTVWQLEDKIRPDNVHFPATGLMCLENTHNRCGGMRQAAESLPRIAAQGLPS